MLTEGMKVILKGIGGSLEGASATIRGMAFDIGPLTRFYIVELQDGITSNGYHSIVVPAIYVKEIYADAIPPLEGEVQ